MPFIRHQERDRQRLLVILSPLSSYHGIRTARGVEVALERRACVGKVRKLPWSDHSFA
jgi:hypothetical protein